MKEMIKGMVQEMVAQAIKEVMAEMMGGSTPVVAKAEVVESKPNEIRMSREEFLAIEEPEEIIAMNPVDFDPVKVKWGKGYTTVVRYNQYISSDIWTANHLDITRKYNAKWSGKLKGYTFQDVNELRTFLASYQIKTELTTEDRYNIKLYKAERAKKQAEYYANKANEMAK